MHTRPLPLVTIGLIAANLLAFAAELFQGGLPFCAAHGLVAAKFVPSSLVTSMFLHDPGDYSHIVGNLAALAFLGFIVETKLGAPLFLALYLAAGVVGGLVHILVDPASTSPMVGASGCLCGLLAVGAALRPRLLPFVVAFIGWNIWLALSGTGAGVSFGAHLGGFFVGVLVTTTLVRREVVA